LIITAPNLPAWLALVDHGDGTATLSGTPGQADVGEHMLALQVMDRSGANAEQAFVIKVMPQQGHTVFLPAVLRRVP